MTVTGKNAYEIGDEVLVRPTGEVGASVTQEFIGTIQDIREDTDGTRYASVKDQDDDVFDVDLDNIQSLP